MSETKQHLEDIREIRSIMERSTQYLSLSGLSGIFAGLVALLGAGFIYFYQQNNPEIIRYSLHDSIISGSVFSASGSEALKVFFITAVIVLVLALSAAFFFSARRARIMSVTLWNSSARRLLVNLFLPITTGGIFCLILLYHELAILIAPSMLIFYGLGLINASKFTLHDIQYLGISEVVLGLIAAVFAGYGLLFWTIGFGFLHIIYGFIMFWKYERINIKNTNASTP